MTRRDESSNDTLSWYEFSHGLGPDRARDRSFQQYFHESLMHNERKVLHRAIAETLEDIYGPRRTAEISPKLAYHYKRGGSRKRMLHLLVMAAESAPARHAPGEAIRFYREAINETKTDHNRTFELMKGLAAAYNLTANRDEQLATAKRMVKIAASISDVGARCDALLELSEA